MTYIPQEKLSKTSDIGINSDTGTTGGNWSVNTYTGAGEKNDYAYVGVNLQVDEAGTLFFDFSQDGTNWSSYPVAGFTVLSGINEVHTAWKGGRYMRPRFVGAGGRSFFRLETYYSNLALPLSVPLNQGIGDDQDAQVVRAVNVGQEPDGTFTSEKVDGVAFRTETPLISGGTYVSPLIITEGYSQIETHLFSNVSGTLTGRWYNDASKTTLLRTFVRPYINGEVGTVSYFSSPKFGPYLEYEYTNGSTNQTTFFMDLHSRTKAISGQVLGMNDFIPSGVVANLGRNVIVGQSQSGYFQNVPVTPEGYLKTQLAGNQLPFGSVHTESLTPVFQLDAVYGLNSGTMLPTSSGSGSAYTEDANFIVNNGSTIFSQAVLQSKARLRYRPGQGIVGRFTTKFTSGTTFSYQIAGFGHPEDGVYFGYKSLSVATPEFGILYVNRGVREIQILDVTTASSTAENISVELNGTTFSDIPVTNSGNLFRTAYEISEYSFPGWTTCPSGSTVIFLAGDAAAKAGAFGLTGTTAVGTFTENKAGAGGIEQFYPQSEWNGDKMDGTGAANNPSGSLLNPQKGNVYEIGIQYLGYGVIRFKIEDEFTGRFQTVHKLRLPNTLDTTTFRNPSFPFTMAAYSAGSTAPLELKAGSIAGFIEGDVITTANRFTYSNGRAAYIDTGNYKPFFTIKNSTVHNGQASQIVINILGLNAGNEDGASLSTVYLIKNGTLIGNPNFTSYSDTSATFYDEAATEVTFDNNNQLVYSLSLAKNGNALVEF